MALDRINARLADRRVDEDSLPGCPWAINSAEHNYCFWSLAKELDGDPLTDKQICQLLNITSASLDKIWNSILNKLRSKKDTQEIRDWIDLLKHKVEKQHVDDTIYMPDKFKAAEAEPEEESDDPDAEIAREMEELADKREKARKKLKKTGMPIHKSGTKTDIYGLYSKKKLEEIKNKK